MLRIAHVFIILYSINLNQLDMWVISKILINDKRRLRINYDCWGVLLESSIEFSEAKQEEFWIPDPALKCPELFNLGIERFRRSSCRTVIKIIHNIRQVLL